MTCRCTSNNLRVFIRNVAQVDVPQLRPFSNQLPGQQFRNLQRVHPAAGQHFSRRTFSSTSSFRDGSDALSAYEAETRKQSQPQNKTQPRPADVESAIVDFSPAAIDAIAAEAHTPPPRESVAYEPRLNIRYDNGPERRLYPRRDDETNMFSRRSRTPNSEFTFPIRRERQPRPYAESKPPKIPIPEGKKPYVRSRPVGASLKKYKVKKLDLGREGEEAEGAGGESALTNDQVRQAMSGDLKDLKDDAEWTPPKREPWQIEKEVAQAKYPDGWNPLRRLSPDAMAGIRALHAQMPEQYTTEVLAQEFKISPEAIRRILKSKWRPKPEEETDRMRRWHTRGENIWGRYAELGMKPPKQWRQLGIGAGRPWWLLEKRQAEAEQRAKLPALLTTSRGSRVHDDQKRAREEAQPDLADRIL